MLLPQLADKVGVVAGGEKFRAVIEVFDFVTGVDRMPDLMQALDQKALLAVAVLALTQTDQILHLIVLTAVDVGFVHAGTLF